MTENQKIDTMTRIEHTLACTDWPLLAQQKLELIKLITTAPDEDSSNKLQGLLNFIDAIQDAAEMDGYPVV